MLSPSRLALAALTGLALMLPLAGCTGLTPVYGARGDMAERVAVRYAAPTSRLEQIIYQDLALRLGAATADAPLVTVAATSSGRDLTNDGVTAPGTQRQVTVSARVTVTAPDGTTLFSGTRAQTADYTTSPQLLARTQAADAAAAQAARLLADTIRLELLAVLAR